MPRVYRSMLADGDGPMVGDGARTLGVRVAPADKPDLPVGDDGFVQPRTGGMSVAPTVGLLPSHRIPKRLRSRYPDARGPDCLSCWRMGNGPFEEGPFAVRLT